MKEWSKDESFFKDYVIDNKLMMKKCFEFDWKSLSFPRIEESELEDMKQVLHKHYRVMKGIYRSLAGQGRLNNLYQISFNVFSNFMLKKSGLIDRKTVQMSEGDAMFNSLIRSRPLEKKNIPSKGLVRFQFMEASIRLALRRYYENGNCNNPADAIE